MDSQFIVEFQNPNAVLEGKEKKSKLLKLNSSLYNECHRKRQILENKFGTEMENKRIDFHLELIKENPTNILLIKRAEEIEKTLIDTGKYQLTPKSIGIEGPFVNGYGTTHITLGFFPKGLPKLDYTQLLM